MVLDSLGDLGKARAQAIKDRVFQLVAQRIDARGFVIQLEPRLPERILDTGLTHLLELHLDILDRLLPKLILLPIKHTILAIFFKTQGRNARLDKYTGDCEIHEKYIAVFEEFAKVQDNRLSLFFQL